MYEKQMELRQATLDLLRDEAYVFLSRDKLEQSEKQADREQASGNSLRMAMSGGGRHPMSGGTPSVFGQEQNLDSVPPDRLDRLVRFETWLQGRIRRELVAYLETASLEYQRFGRIQQLLNEWEFGVRRMLPDTLAQFASTLRAVHAAATSSSGTPATTLPAALGALRDAAQRLEHHDRQLGQIASAIAGYAHSVSQRAMRVPTLPQFRRTVWVDWLSLIPVEQVAGEVSNVESEVHAFLDAGVHPALARSRASRECCAQLQESFLQTYWNQLRIEARMHRVEKRTVDAVLILLGQRYDAEIALAPRIPTQHPFLSGPGRVCQVN